MTLRCWLNEENGANCQCQLMALGRVKTELNMLVSIDDLVLLADWRIGGLTCVLIDATGPELCGSRC